MIGIQHKISVIGAGAWGTALAQVIASKSQPVTLWARSETLAQAINAAHENTDYLAGIALGPSLHATHSLYDALKNDILLMVTPAQAMRSVLEEMKPHIRPDHALVLCSKGIEISSGKMMADVTAEILPQTPCAILTGPNFADEIARGDPAATTLACADPVLGPILQDAIASPSFRPYLTEDMVGAQIAGALKNVIAIACGIARGMGLGESTRASLITRGMAEITRLGCAMGAKRETFTGLCGFGDMILTCSSEKSRNFSLGYALGKGQSLQDILGERKTVTEGVYTATAAASLSAQYNVTMPITSAVNDILNHNKNISTATQEMLNRPLGFEV